MNVQTVAEPHPKLSPELRAAFTDIGKKLPDLWQDDVFTRTQKKSLLRCLIDKVVLHRVAGDIIHIRIVWKGGDVTTTDLSVTVGALSALSDHDKLEQRIIALSKQGLDDRYIAKSLTQEGFRSPSQLILIPSTVQRIRLKHRIFQKRPPSRPRQVPGYLTVPQLAASLSCPSQWIYRRIKKGIITITQEPQSKLYLFPDHPDTLAKFQALSAGKVKTLNFSKEVARHN